MPLQAIPHFPHTSLAPAHTQAIARTPKLAGLLGGGHDSMHAHTSSHCGLDREGHELAGCLAGLMCR